MHHTWQRGPCLVWLWRRYIPSFIIHSAFPIFFGHRNTWTQFTSRSPIFLPGFIVALEMIHRDLAGLSGASCLWQGFFFFFKCSSNLKVRILHCATAQGSSAWVDTIWEPRHTEHTSRKCAKCIGRLRQKRQKRFWETCRHTMLMLQKYVVSTALTF